VFLRSARLLGVARQRSGHRCALRTRREGRALPAPELSAQQICGLARAGDALALEEVARAGRYLGIGIANLITLYVPELIVLSGSVMNSADLFMPAIREVVRRQCGYVPRIGSS